MHTQNITAQQALQRLKDGNAAYMRAEKNPGDISAALRAYTQEHGQQPYAVVVACSDSRVVPEHIFSAGLGELFVIRVAGNVMAEHQFGSVEYAAEHLGCPLLVILGHTNCGAVGAAIHDEPGGYVHFLTDEIRKAIGGETDDYRASCLNVKRGVEITKKALPIASAGLTVVGAVYHIGDGRVEFL